MNKNEGFGGLYKDGWILIFKKLDEVSIISLSHTCKNAYYAVKDHFAKQILCKPFKSQYKLTVEQFRCLYELNTDDEINKRVVADVGSGKTLLALAYIFRKYLLGIGGKIHLRFPGPNELPLSFDPQPPKIIICAPPANIAQWSDAIEKFTNEKYISTYSGAKNYTPKWRELYKNPEHRIILTSMYILQNFLKQLHFNRIRYVIIADECHHITFGPGKSNYLRVEILGLTASEERDKSSAWGKTFVLESTLLRSQLKPPEFVRYNYTGLTEYQRTAIKQSLHNVKKKITRSEQKRIMQQSMYGELLEYHGSFQVEKKRFIFDRSSDVYRTDVFLEILMHTPKVIALVALAWKIKQKGEKLVVFDTSETGLSLLHLALRSNNIISYPFVTDYNPKERSNLIKKFQKDGDVILGSIGMLGEGQNITEGNHLVFIGNPNNAEQYKQALGRIRRFPQEKQVYVHIIASCAIEEYFILNFIAGNYESIDKSEVFELLSEFID